MAPASIIFSPPFFRKQSTQARRNLPRMRLVRGTKEKRRTVEGESKRSAAAVVDESPIRRHERVVDGERAQDLVNLATEQRLGVFLYGHGAIRRDRTSFFLK